MWNCTRFRAMGICGKSSLAAAVLLIVCAQCGALAAQTEAALCVIDDSKDMVDRPKLRAFDGFSSVNNDWPILSYLLPELGCHSYCSWTDFRTQDEHCKSSGSIDTPRIPEPLQETSPLSGELFQASQRESGLNRFFITNGIDWLIKGGQHAVEMDISGPIANWLKANDTLNDVILGVVQDNFGRVRRPNMVIGFVRGFGVPYQADASCTWSPVATPRSYRISLTAYHNPRRVLTEGALEIFPVMTFLFYLDGESRKVEYKISPDGRVDVPRAMIQNAKDLKLSVTFLLPPEHTGRFCGSIQGQFEDSNPVNATCKPSSDGHALTCEFIAALQGAVGASLKLVFTSVPQKAPWLEGLVATHAMTKTYEGLYQQLRLPMPVRVSAGHNVPNLIIVSKGA